MVMKIKNIRIKKEKAARPPDYQEWRTPAFGLIPLWKEHVRCLRNSFEITLWIKVAFYRYGVMRTGSSAVIAGDAECCPSLCGGNLGQSVFPALRLSGDHIDFSRCIGVEAPARAQCNTDAAFLAFFQIKIKISRFHPLWSIIIRYSY